MTLQSLLESSFEFVNVLNEKVDLLEIKNNPRNRAASACLHLSFEHHASILILLNLGHSGSAFALLRAQLESYVRGVWLNRCATDDEVDLFISDKLNPGFGTLVKAIENIEVFQQGTLSKIKREGWDALCSYAHGGGRQVTRRNTEEEITSNYSDEEKIEVIETGNLFALLASAESADISRSEALANAVYMEYKARFSVGP